MSERRDAIDNLLSLRRACPEAVVWSRRFRTLEEAWEGLDSPAWALWALEKFGYRDERKLRQFAVACAERCKALWDDPQRARAIEVASRAATGAASRDDLLAAYVATRRCSVRAASRKWTVRSRLGAWKGRPDGPSLFATEEGIVSAMGGMASGSSVPSGSICDTW